MSKKATFSNEPAPVSWVTDDVGTVHVEIAVNPQYVETEDMKGWVCDYAAFHFYAGMQGAPTEETVKANPSGFLTLAGDLGELRDTYINAAQIHMDREAHTHGYDNIFTVCSYATSKNPVYAAEASACVDWRDAVWQHSIRFAGEVLAGARPLTTVEEFIKGLPKMEWPEVQ